MSVKEKDKISSGVVHFSITGEFVTDHARDRVLEGDWEDAIRFLNTSIVGIDYNICIAVLSGISEFVGTNDLELEERTNAKYMQELDRMYGSYVRINRKWYKPYAYVSSYGSEDSQSEYDYQQNDIERAKFYCEDKASDKIFLLEYRSGQYNILFKRVESPPIWMEIDKTPQQAANATNLDEDGFVIRYGDKHLVEYAEKKKGKQNSKKKKAIEITEDDVELAEIVPPTVDKKLSSKYGWISPTGDFYCCEYAGHIDLSYRIIKTMFDSSFIQGYDNSEEALEKRGWMKLGGMGKSQYFLSGEKKPTQAQQNVVWDLSQKYKIRFPKYLFE